MTPRLPVQILQELAKEIPNLAKGTSFQQRVSGVSSDSTGFTFDGEAPSHGAHTSDGKLFCGSYTHRRWFDDDMEQHRDEIKELREKHQPEGKPSPAKHKNQVRKHKVKVKELQKQNEQLQLKLSALKSGDKDAGGEKGGQPGANAGDSFGGRDSMGKPT
jgi:hypothetical protein